MKMFKILGVVICFIPLLTACGVKGKLELPPSPTMAQKQTDIKNN